MMDCFHGLPCCVCHFNREFGSSPGKNELKLENGSGAGVAIEDGVPDHLQVGLQPDRWCELERVERLKHVFVFVVDGLRSFRGLAPDESHAEQIVPQLWNQAGVTERSLHNE